MERPLVTDQSFYKYLKCPSWISHEVVSDPGTINPLIATLQQDGLLRAKELELLKDRTITEVELDDMEEAAQRTMELMQEGAQTIYKGVLLSGHHVGRPDILERVEGKSEIGDWYYVACDMKRSSQLKDEYLFQGAFYAELLYKIQGVRPQKGYVLHGNGELEDYVLEDVRTQMHLTLDSIEAILDGETEQHFLTSGCKQSPWFSECEKTTHTCRDLSLINRIWRSEARALEAVGIHTVEALASASLDTLREVKDVTMDRLYFLQQQAIAIVDKEVLHVGTVDLPKDEPVALVVDIESDPLRDVHYLFGVLVVENGTETYHTFLAETPEEEEKAWNDFLNFLEPYTDTHMYHYGWYEVDVFRRLVEAYGAPKPVEKIFAERMIDLLARLRGSLIFPSPFYSLKDIAKHLGFRWRSGDVSGIDSILWYHDWIEKGDKEKLQAIIDYNEDDVRATWHVRNWVVENIPLTESEI